jgi:hypothetical protein
MKKIHTSTVAKSDGSVMVQTVILASGINPKALANKFGIKEEIFYNQEREIELSLSSPKIYICKDSTIRSIAGAEANERVYVVRQIQKEKFV